MKKLVLFSLLVVTQICSHVHATELDRIVAVINEDVVTQSELNHSLSIAKTQISQNHMTIPSDDILRKQVLDQIINKKLQLQIAKQVGIDVSQEEIDRIVQNVASKNNISTDTLYQRISEGGITRTEYRQELQDQMIVQKLQQQQVGSHLSVTPGEINAFMQSKLWKSNTNKEYRLEDR